MAKANSSTGKVFDVDTIKQFVELMHEHELTEIDLQEADQKIRLCKRENVVATGVPAAVPAAVPVAAAVNESANITTINSPMVGTFYSKSKPEAPDYVKVGDSVSSETVVCVLEAMKTFNELPAGVSGKIVEVLVKNEEAVDVNKPLFKVDTSQS